HVRAIPASKRSRSGTRPTERSPGPLRQPVRWSIPEADCSRLTRRANVLASPMGAIGNHLHVESTESVANVSTATHRHEPARLTAALLAVAATRRLLRSKVFR